MPQSISPFEQHKKNQEVITAGRHAYRALILLTGNLYTKAPYRDLWEKGWRLERKLDDSNRRYQRDPQAAPFKKSGDQRSGTPPQRRERSFNRNAPRRPAEPQTVDTSKLVARFNNRFHTRA